ncbi:MAG: ankyrin repeat domain-containing protein [Pseudomonadota bacterium]
MRRLLHATVLMVALVAGAPAFAADKVDGAAADGTTPLHWAVFNGDAAKVDALIKAHADVNARNRFGSTPLYEAALAGNTGIIRKLLKAKADPNAASEGGMTALMIVARTPNLEAVQALIDAGADVNARAAAHGETALIYASAQGQAEIVRALMKAKADPEIRTPSLLGQRQVSAEPRAQQRPVGNMNALMYAARQGCALCAKYLIEGGANPSASDPENTTALQYALLSLNFDAAKEIILGGAEVNRWDWWGRSHLYALADVSTLPKGGRSDQLSLDKTQPVEIAKLLLDRGADPDIQLKLLPPYRALGNDRGLDVMLTFGTTALIRAAKGGDVPLVKILLEHGADPNLATNRGLTPVMTAAGLGSNDIDSRGIDKTQAQAIETLKVLLAFKGDINRHATDTGRTALHGAAMWGWNDVVQFLVDNGADLFAKDNGGMLPLDSALGKAGGFGRQNAVNVRPETADLIRKLMTAKQPQSVPPVAQNAAQ